MYQKCRTFEFKFYGINSKTIISYFFYHADHCTLHSSLGTIEFLNKHKAASKVPAEDCPIKLAIHKLLEKYEKTHGKIGQEKDGKGRRRLLKVLNILEKEGVICMIDNKVRRMYSISIISLLCPPYQVDYKVILSHILVYYKQQAYSAL